MLTYREREYYNISLVQRKQLFKEIKKHIFKLYKKILKHGDEFGRYSDEMNRLDRIATEHALSITTVRKKLRADDKEPEKSKIQQHLDNYNIYNKTLNNRSLGFDENNEPLVDDYAWWKACSYQRFLLYRQKLKLLTEEQKRKLYVTSEGDYYLFITVATIQDNEPTDFQAEDKCFAVVRNLLYLDSNDDDAELINLHEFHTKKHLGIPFYRYIGDLV